MGSLIGGLIGSLIGSRIGGLIGGRIGSVIGGLIGSPIGGLIGSLIGGLIGNLKGGLIAGLLGSHTGSSKIRKKRFFKNFLFHVFGFCIPHRSKFGFGMSKTVLHFDSLSVLEPHNFAPGSLAYM